MSVKAKIMKTLAPLELDVCYLERDNDGTFPFVVFNVAEIPLEYADDEEEVTMYMVTINIFSKPEYNFESVKLQILSLMKNAGFRKTQIPNAEFLEGEKVYNQPMGFVYYEYH